MNFKSLQGKAKQLIDRRGGTGSLKEDAQELKDIAKGPGSVADKAKRAGEAIKEPGAKVPDTPVAPGRAVRPAPSAFRTLRRVLPRGLIAALVVALGGAGAFAADRDETLAARAPVQVQPTPTEQATETPEQRRRRLEREIVWRRSTAAGLPNAGRLIAGVKLPAEGVHFSTWDPIRWRAGNQLERRYATDRLIRTILRVARQYRAANAGAPRILVGDLSRPRGGSFDGRFGDMREFGSGPPTGGHVSHQNGLDADIYYPRKDRQERAPASWAQVDRRLAQDLVNRFAAAGAQFVFVGPRTGLRGRSGIVQQVDYHHDHLHVRLR